MMVKTFEGSTIKDAISAVKREFGSEAIILSTDHKKIEGSTASMYEVKAAMPNSSSRQNQSGASRSDNNNSLVAEDLENFSNRLDQINNNIAKLSETLATKTSLQNLEGGVQELKYLVLDTLKKTEGSSIDGLKDCLIPIERVLRVGGLGNKHIVKLLSWLKEIPEPSTKIMSSFDGFEDYYKSQAIRWMVKKISIAPRWSIIDGSTSLQAFVGPSGSGKTNAIAKLAAHYIREEKKKILLVSYENTKLAAEEQLRIFAKVLGCSFVSISTPEELEAALLEHRDCDLALIDTAGRYPKHDNQISDLKSLSSHCLPIQFHLVLSVTEKEEHLDRAVRGFSPLGINSILFSKLDESWTFGEIFNLSHKWSLPLSFFSTGQKVPDDLERSTRERVVERIFGL
jgi:flagellar biosynthesis protein FlhF